MFKSKSTDVRPVGCVLYFLPLQLRLPLKFGSETLTSVICARVSMTVKDAHGRVAQGWGETPLSVQWVWPAALPYDQREAALQDFCARVAARWAGFSESGHPIEVGHGFTETELRHLWCEFNRDRARDAMMPWLAALVCSSAFDLALHDAYGVLHGLPVYQTYNRDFLNSDLSAYLQPAESSRISFAGLYPCDFLSHSPETRLAAWHLVGGKDLIDDSELTGTEPHDGYPVLLRDWIRRDGLTCLKVKLRGNDAAWDYERLARVGRIAVEERVIWLTADFNCTVEDPAYVNTILDELMRKEPRLFGMLLYIEQPFPYELEENQIDVHAVSARKPLFMDESAHDWKLVRLGRSLGWTGVALKTCKTQSGALLSACWAKAHGMTLMVQDLTNPMLAQIPHVMLAAHVGTIMGVETNSMQFYPDASRPEAAVHPGLFQRRAGVLDLSTVSGAGFGYRVQEIRRSLPPPAVTAGDPADC